LNLCADNGIVIEWDGIFSAVLNAPVVINQKKILELIISKIKFTRKDGIDLLRLMFSTPASYPSFVDLRCRLEKKISLRDPEVREVIQEVYKDRGSEYGLWGALRGLDFLDMDNLMMKDFELLVSEVTDLK
jgi:hypothetical protein